jgi:SRSO17 transposase
MVTPEVDKSSVFAPERWGLPDKVIDDLADHLRDVWSRYRDNFKTTTRDTSEYAWVYLRGILTMERARNFVNIARRIIDPDDDGQNLQQFMSDSPWPSRGVFRQIQGEIGQRLELRGGMLTLDESGKKRAGDQSAGAGHQYLGRMGKVDMGQVGVCLGYYKDGVWTMVDALLYLPEAWFDDEHADLRKRWHIPADRSFATKPQQGLKLILRAKANGLPFEIVGADSLYGRDSHFRAGLDAADILYIVDIPVDTQVYLNKPVVGVPETPPGKPGPPFSQPRVLSEEKPVEVRSLMADMTLQAIEIRHTERGLLVYQAAARRIWTVTEAGEVREEWLLIWQGPNDNRIRFSLGNAPAETSLEQLACWRAQRYFAERIFQDAKSEAGWDELVARKYRAWMHHTALDALALWFMAETKLDWAQAHPRDPQLVEQLEVVVLPALSMANVRELLRAILPLNPLSPQLARRLVIKHLVNRTRSTRCRLKKQQQSRAPT